MNDPVEVLDELAAAGRSRYGAAVGGTPMDALDLTGPVALVLGNEAHGLPAEVLDRLDATIAIPMARPGREPQRRDGRHRALLRSRPPAGGAMSWSTRHEWSGAGEAPSLDSGGS